MKKLTIASQMILLVIAAVSMAVVVTSLFTRNYIINRETEVIHQKIRSTAYIVAHDEQIQSAVEREDFTGIVQERALEWMALTEVDFIVVMDLEFIRFSHPNDELIGLPFSNIKDAEQALETDHFSVHEGTMGVGTRFFTRMYNSSGELIGLVCVGYVQKTVENQLHLAQQQILFALFVGIVIGSILALVFAHTIKKVLLDLEPEEIANSLIERHTISNRVKEGLLAINPQQEILVVNQSFKDLMQQVGLDVETEVGQVLSHEHYTLLFEDIFQHKQALQDKPLTIHTTDLLLNTNLVYLNEQLHGAVLTVRDQSSLKQLANDLIATEQYNDALREQSHHFMNQLYVLQGLIDLEQYTEVRNFISHLNHQHHQHLGHVSNMIKAPILTGFLLGKIEQAKKEGITIEIDPDSQVLEENLSHLYHDLTLILGVLLDNAIEAMMPRQASPYIRVFLYLSLEEDILLCHIEDNGCGFSVDKENSLFEKGYSTKGECRGFGLYSVKQIVEQYGGRIDVTSSPYQSTYFAIELPLAVDKE